VPNPVARSPTIRPPLSIPRVRSSPCRATNGPACSASPIPTPTTPCACTRSTTPMLSGP
jgi:hypothetical protein